MPHPGNSQAANRETVSLVPSSFLPGPLLPEHKNRVWPERLRGNLQPNCRKHDPQSGPFEGYTPITVPWDLFPNTHPWHTMEYTRQSSSAENFRTKRLVSVRQTKENLTRSKATRPISFLALFSETGCLCTAVLELTMVTELASNLQRSACFCLLSAGIEGMCHHAWLLYSFNH